ncbi:MAG: DUF3540 domain-containing protein [Desulfovibrionaceae bacterium]
MSRSTAVTPIDEARSGLLERGGRGLAVGRVLAVDEQGVQVLTEDGRRREAKRAAACLLAPEKGDAVLVLTGRRPAYVLSVLEKSGDASTLSFAGDVAIESKGKASLRGREVDIAGVSGSLRFMDLSVVSRGLRLKLDKAVCLARAVESVLGSSVVRMKESFRRVTGTDTLRAGEARRFIAGGFHQRSQNAAILAEEKVKVDGERIELG